MVIIYLFILDIHRSSYELPALLQTPKSHLERRICCICSSVSEPGQFDFILYMLIHSLVSLMNFVTAERFDLLLSSTNYFLWWNGHLFLLQMSPYIQNTASKWANFHYHVSLWSTWILLFPAHRKIPNTTWRWSWWAVIIKICSLFQYVFHQYVFHS